MCLTFPDQRRLMSKNVELSDVRAEYPALFNFKQIVAEFERILGVDTSLLATFQHNFCPVVKQIIQLGKEKEKKKKCGIEKFLKLLELGEDDDDNNGVDYTLDEKAQVAMAVIPFLFKSNIQDFIRFIPAGSDMTAKEVALEKDISHFLL